MVHVPSLGSSICVLKVCLKFKVYLKNMYDKFLIEICFLRNISKKGYHLE